VSALKAFELTIPADYLKYVKNEIKKPKRPNTELLELWLERELSIENESSYGNVSTDESHVTVQVLPNGNYKIIISDACFSMVANHVQPEPHSYKMSNEDVLHYWLDIKTNKLHLQEHIGVRELINE
jgi:hypothetical protein